METDVEAPYRYAGFGLTPAAFAEVVIALAGGTIARRADLIDLVVTHHVANGGTPLTTNSVSVAKRALSLLESKGLASSAVAFGMWSISGERADPVAQASNAAFSEEALDSSEFLYVYYLPAYRDRAILEKSDEWPHKVGMTRTSVASRLASQVGTALPERPVVVLAIPVERAAALERAVHAVLELRGKRVTDAPGNEWFVTNTSEILSILDFCGISYAMESEG
jgi:hypothetical protein